MRPALVTVLSAMTDFNPRTPCGVRLIRLFPAASTPPFQSTHPLRGATLYQCNNAWPHMGFQSTHPLRGATDGAPTSAVAGSFQSTHPLRGATPGTRAWRRCCRISIHAPLAGCDLVQLQCNLRIRLFQSTHPLRGATPCLHISTFTGEISIHAPLAGCDAAV